jgi:DNA mismatch repair protein MutL
MIEILAPQVANMIAAGEVVERPASAVKELLENAADAGATAITAEIRRGGVSLIRVTDNGVGMDAGDAARAFIRHATSKLRTAEDLTSIRTMGFRGEALAAIAAVSRIELLTRKRGETCGTALTLEAGVVTESGEAGCPEGTTILIRDLFYNTPARQKFLKKDNTEAAQAQEAAIRAALGHPELSIRFLRDGSQVLHTPGDGNLKNCLYAVFGREFSSALLPLSENVSSGEHLVGGFVGSPQFLRGSRLTQYFLLNKRPVRSRLLTAALEEAYTLPTGRYPVCCLHLTIPPELVDVNVHPAKTEVKFQDERAVFNAVYHACVDALRDDSAPPVRIMPYTPAGGRIPVYTPTSPQLTMDSGLLTANNEQLTTNSGQIPDNNTPSELFNGNRSPSTDPRGPLPPEGDGIQRTPGNAMAVITEQIADTRQENAAGSGPPDAPQEQRSWRLIGEAMSGYLLVETPDALWIIDKHAAHERLLYNRLKAGERPLMTQQLITPRIVSLPQPEVDTLTEETVFLTGAGFELDEMGPGTLAVRAAPGDIDESALPGLLGELASLLRDKRRPEIREEAFRLVACKAAVKLGKSARKEDMEHLAGLVMETPDLRHCPHGRPVALRMTRGELYRQFGR